MKLRKSELISGKTIQIGGSKSISNRLLILKALFGHIKVENLSDAQDTELLENALHSDSQTIDIHHAGTAMRFLTSYFALQNGRNVILTGSGRMKQRPIKPLVDALKKLGANIEYLENDGFPPLKISGSNIQQNYVKIPANISSQFITSLLLIAGKLENGLEVELDGEITSKPYLEMTLSLLSELGIENEFIGNTIKIQPYKKHNSCKNFTVESDWSSASYLYSFAAIGRKEIILKTFNKNSLQGDRRLSEIYEDYFGIKTDFDNGTITLRPIENFSLSTEIQLDMNDCPDVAQTVCVTATALKIPFKITGLATLKVKETDRLTALQNELEKIGCTTEITENSIKSISYNLTQEEISIKTYNDHRMAMSFAPFCLVSEINIENPEVVEKSYPKFWEDIAEILV